MPVLSKLGIKIPIEILHIATNAVWGPIFMMPFYDIHRIFGGTFLV